MSLSAHLQASGDHAVLPFDPACPACRHERLAGRLPAAPLVPPRLTALAVAGVTAGCALAPAPAALAQAPPVAEEELPELPTDVEDEPVESDVPDPNVPDVPTEDPADAIDPADPPPPTDPALLGGAPTPAAPTPAVPTPVPPPAEPVAQPAPPPVPAPPAETPAKPPTPAKPRPTKAPRRVRAPEPAKAALPPSPSPAPAPAPAPPQPPPAALAGASYVVRPGDTLWSIAHARLGRSAGPAAVAAFVEAIWRANSAAIGTGDPDLIRAGMRLVIPAQR